MFFIGILTECLAIWNNINLTADQITEANRLFSADPLTDIILGLGFYVPLAVVWFFLLKKYNYQTKEAFTTMGISGILFEGEGLIFLSFNPIMWAYAFVIHGSYFAMAHMIINKDPYFIINDRKSISIF